METFLLAFKYKDDQQAVSCIDLSNRNLSRSDSVELAHQLKAIIDRIVYVDFETIPDDNQGDPYAFHESPEGDVVIAVNAAGEWLFTPETVDAIPKLLDWVGDRSVVPALWLRSKMPESLTRQVFLMEHWQWLGLALLILAGFLLDRVITLVLALIVGKWLRENWITVEPDVLNGALRPLGLLAMALLWWGGLLTLALEPRQLSFLMVAIKFIAAAAVVWSAYRMLDVMAGALERRAAKTSTKLDDLLVPLIRKSAKVFIGAFGLIFIADNLDVDISSLLAGLGLGGFALAMASQDTVKNLFGSLTVLLDGPFLVGDWVVVNNIEGTVEEVGFRNTRIRTFYDSVVCLPNSTLLTASVDNYGARRHRRWSTRIAITYDTPPERIDAFCEAIRELIQQHPHTRKDYYHVYLNEFGASTLEVLLYVFFNTPDWGTELQERHRLAVDILRIAARLGVELAFPTQTLYLQRPSQSRQSDLRHGSHREPEEEN